MKKISQMIHNIYNVPFTRINEHWILNGEFNSFPDSPYIDYNINTKANSFHFNELELYPSWYNKVAFDIVTETVYNYPHPRISEKTIRPIGAKCMFIIVGAPYTLQMLQNKGFKTFSPFINEEYDNLQDPVQRIHAIQKEIKRLCDISINQINNVFVEYKHIIEHNFSHLKYVKEQEIIKVNKQLDND